MVEEGVNRRGSGERGEPTCVYLFVYLYVYVYVGSS